MPRATAWQQILLLVKMKFLLYRKSGLMRMLCAMEIAGPLCVLALTFFISLTGEIHQATVYPGVNSSQVVTTDVMSPQYISSWHFFVAPNVTDAKRLMDIIVTSILPNTSYTIFGSQNAMDVAYMNLTIRNKVIGVLFQGLTMHQYSLRFPYATFDDSLTTLSQISLLKFCRVNRSTYAYLNSGFAAIQIAIDTAIAKMIDSNFTGMTITAREMPRDAISCINKDHMALMTAGPLCLVAAFCMFLLIILLPVIPEEDIMKRMKIMGLDNFKYWCSWGIVHSFWLLVTTFIMTLIGYYGGIWPLSNLFLVFLLLFIYGLSVEMIGYMITPIFRRTSTAALFAFLLSFGMCLPSLFILPTGNFPEVPVWFLYLLSPTAFAFLMSEVIYFDTIGEGAQFFNLGEGLNPMYIGIMMMIVDIFLYFLLAQYLHNVVPDKYGKRRPINYFLKPAYWTKKTRGLAWDYMSHESVMSAAEHERHEMISFHNLRKVFQTKSIFNALLDETVAIEDFTQNIYKGQITAVQGHSGAGKTTLFNILAGLVTPTSGLATVCGYDVSNSEDIDEIHKIMGVCPQHNIFNRLFSVWENLELFGSLKGYVGKENSKEVQRVLSVVDLLDQKDTRAMKLSGNQKRKLSFGIAIIGDPKILILDEPTASMDCNSRGKLWDWLKSNKQEKITLVITHVMGEADGYADCIVNMDCGSTMLQQQCDGSSSFLKMRYSPRNISKTLYDTNAVPSCSNTHDTDTILQMSTEVEHAQFLPSSQDSCLSENVGSNKPAGYSASTILHDEIFDEENVSINKQDESLFPICKRHEVCDEAYGQQVLLQLVKKTLLMEIRNAVIVFMYCLVLAAEVVSTWYISTLFSKEDDPVAYDVTYQNNLDDYDDKSVLYNGLAGVSNNSFVINIPHGVSLEANSLSDSELLKSNFYPHYVGLDMDIFNITQVICLALCNTSHTRSLPSAINLVSNSITSFLNGGVPVNIVVYSKQWSQTGRHIFEIGTELQLKLLPISILSIGILYIVFFTADNLLVKEHKKTTIQLQISGVSYISYWGARLLVCYVFYFPSLITFIFCIYAFGIDGLNNAGATGILILLLLGWGVSCILATFIVRSFTGMIWHFIALEATYIPYGLVEFLDVETAKWLNLFCLILNPFYCGMSGIYSCFQVYLNPLASSGRPLPNSTYIGQTRPMILESIIMIYVHILVFGILPFVFHVREHGGQRLRCSSAQRIVENDDYDRGEDTDVADERRMILHSKQGRAQSIQRPMILFDGLRKEFTTQTDNSVKVAVRNLSLAVYPGEVIGLLGPSGAGKTTALEVLTTEIKATKGRASVIGQVIASGLSNACNTVGYCPQINPLWTSLTVKEHLEIYATIRGVPSKEISSATKNIMTRLHILHYQDKRAGILSGGTKRKLCIAMAMIGNPKILLLDQPSTGLDITAKRNLWEMISTDIKGSSRCAILVTNNLTEAKAVCTRIGIMVQGELRCLGSNQHLTDKFSQDYILEFKLKQQQDEDEEGDGNSAIDRITELNKSVRKIFQWAGDPKKIGNLLIYKIAREGFASMPHVLSLLDEVKKRPDIEDYTFAELSLDQQYCHFEYEQNDADGNE